MTASSASRLDQAVTLLRALGNPGRLAIIRELGKGEQCVHDLVDALGLSQPLVSQHLRVLRGERLVSGRRRSREVVYTLTDAHIARIADDAVRHAAERRKGS